MGGFSVIVKTDCETDGSYAALLVTSVSIPLCSDTEETHYDSGRYYRTGSAAKDLPDGCVFDSPASPEMGHHVSGSPLKVIPRSPVRTAAHGSEDDQEEEEDMDEDLLYLRLIALRSLEAVEEEKTDEAVDDNDNKLAGEMKELLEEAELAAQENSDDVETGTQQFFSD